MIIIQKIQALLQQTTSVIITIIIVIEQIIIKIDVNDLQVKMKVVIN